MHLHLLAKRRSLPPPVREEKKNRKAQSGLSWMGLELGIAAGRPLLPDKKPSYPVEHLLATMVMPLVLEW